MNEELARLYARIDTYIEEMAAFQTELTAVPALGPESGGQGEGEKVRVIERWLERLRPDEVFQVDAPDPRVASGVRPNLMARLHGRNQGRVWVLSHVDVVPPGEPGLWVTDPWVLKREGDFVYGRGVEDNQHGIVASFFAAQAFRDEGLVPGREVALAFVADEETGSRLGLGYLLNTRPDLFSPDDLIIVPDAGKPDGTLIEVAEKSLLWLRFTVTGKQCHASTPDQGRNTLRAAARMITALDDDFHGFFTAADPLYTLPASTFEPTRKEANVPNVNTIPGEDVFYFDTRVLPAYSLADVKDRAQRVAQGVAEASGVTVRVESVNEVQAPKPTPTDAPVVQALFRAIAAVTGRTAKPQGIGGGTVAALFREKGLPAAVWSTIDHYAHAPNERDRLSNLVTDAKILAHVYWGA
jgi:succinyl-diaminopimelate desuccinylase